jgi:hypothetical protein
VGTQREMQERREAWEQPQHQSAWLQASMQALQGARSRPKPRLPPCRSAGAAFELLSDDVVENKILASRMALAMGETAARLRGAAPAHAGMEGRELPSGRHVACRDHLPASGRAMAGHGPGAQDLQRVLDRCRRRWRP